MGRHRRDVLLLDCLVAGLFAFALVWGALQGGFQRNPGGATGAATSVSSTVLVTKAENATCILNLVEGWNLVSTYCEPDNGSIAAVTATINDSLISVHAYNPTESFDHWEAYAPWLPNWTVQDLGNITRTKGYWVDMAQNATLIHNGTWYSPTFVPLREPLTLAGYPANITYPVNLSLAAIASSVDAVYLYNATDAADHWKVYRPAGNPALNDLTELVPFHGLWFMLLANESWMVIWE